MRLIFAILAGVIAAAPANADDKDLHAFQLHIGDHGVIEVRGVETITGPGSSKGSRAEEDIDLAYMAVDDGYRVTATAPRYDEFDQDGYKKPKVLMAMDAEFVREAFYPFVYAANDRLKPLRVENWEQIRSRLAAVDKATADYYTHHLGKEIAEARREASESQWDRLTPGDRPSLISRLSMATPYTYPPMAVNQPVSDVTSADMIRNGSHVKITIEKVTTLSAWDPAAGTAHVIYDKTVMPSGVTPEALAAWKDGPQRVDDKVWAAHRHCEVDIDLTTGLASKSVCSIDDGHKPEPGHESSDIAVFTLTLKH